MSPKFLAIQPQKWCHTPQKLVTIGMKVPTTPEGGNHGHTNTITMQPSETLHTAEPQAKNSRKNSNTPKPMVETTIALQPIKIPSNTAEPRVENLKIKGRNHQEPRAKSQEPRAKSQEPRAKSQEPRAESQEPRAKSQELRAESREPRTKSLTPKKEPTPNKGAHSQEGAWLPRRSSLPRRRQSWLQRQPRRGPQACQRLPRIPPQLLCQQRWWQCRPSNWPLWLRCQQRKLWHQTEQRNPLSPRRQQKRRSRRWRQRPLPFFPVAVPVVKASA